MLSMYICAYAGVVAAWMGCTLPADGVCTYEAPKNPHEICHGAHRLACCRRDL